MKVGVPLAKAGAKAVARNAAPMIDRMMVEKYGFPSLQPGIVKNPGGEWLTGGTDGPSNLDHALIDLLGSEHPGPPVDEVAAFNQKYRKMLKNYIVNDMGAATDPIRMSIDRGISHADVPHSMRLSYLDTQAEKYGLPKGNLAVTHEGRRWEDRVDQLIGVANLGEWQKYRPEKFDKSYPWLAKKDPGTIVHDLEDPATFSNLGFDHMRDVLLNKYMAGEITPEQLRNMNMTKAMQIVHDANLAATAGAGEAEAKGYAANLLLPRSKEYASGHYISELPDPSTSDEAMALVNKIGCEGGWCTQNPDSARRYGSGENKLHTLFDKEGRPHVQYQVTEETPYLSSGNNAAAMPREERMAIMSRLSDPVAFGGPSSDSPADWRKAYKQLYPEKMGQAIEQMKPPENSWLNARAQEYTKRDPNYQSSLQVPMQDFVKSGNWTEVRDLQNAGLYKITSSGMRPALEHKALAKQLSTTPEQLHEFHLSRPEDSSPYFTEKEFRDFINMQDTPPIEKAEGGVVHMYGGGIVKAAGKGLRGLAEKYRLAHELAQKNAALPVSKGGLGLPPDNTALDRAKALGFDIYNKYFHGTGDDFTEFDPNSFFTSNPRAASTYAEERGNTYAIDKGGNSLKAANVMPVYVKAKKYADDDAVISAAKKTKMYDPEIEDSYYYTSPNYDNFSAKAAPVVTAELKKKGYDAAKHYDFDMDGNEIISSQFFDPSQIRSTSAAFDPFRRGEADILAGVGIGLPVTGLIDRQEPVKKAKGGEVDYDKHYEFVQHTPISSTIDHDAMYMFR
jgi:predicted small secreted protein